MVVRIRLSRFGHIHRPFYRIAVAFSRFHVKQKRFIEHVGSYDPIVDPMGNKHLRLNIPRVKYWLSVGAQPSKMVSRILSRFNLLPSLPFTQTVQPDMRLLRGYMDFPIGPAELSRRKKASLNDVFPKDVKFGLKLAKSPLDYQNIINAAKKSDKEKLEQKLKETAASLNKVKELLKTAKGNSCRPELVPRHWRSLYRFGELLHPVKFPFGIAPTDSTQSSWQKARSQYGGQYRHSRNQLYKVVGLDHLKASHTTSATPS